MPMMQYGPYGNTPGINPAPLGVPNSFLEDMGLGDPIMGAATLGGGALAGYLGGKQDVRNQQNRFEYDVASDRQFRPNRAVSDALRRNLIAAILEQGGTSGGLQSLTGGINPLLLEELKNIAGVPGLNIAGQQISPNVQPNFKGPSFLESLGGFAGGVLGGLI